LKLYNKATAPAETDTPLVTLALQASASFALTLGDGQGLDFNTGIGYRMTTGSADADTGALSSGDVLGFNILYQ
jgi:hypothetical protein